MAPLDLEALTCSNCAAKNEAGEAEAAGWRYWSDGVGELHPFCGFCAAREFWADASASTDRRIKRS